MIRPAAAGDASAIAALAAQLGYPATDGEIRERLAGISARGGDAVFVSEEGGRVVAWIALRGGIALDRGASAEISGLVVDAASRGRGIGEALVRFGEAWARENGFPLVRVRSRTSRERAHAFYGRLGYSVTKTQLVFDKDLETR